MFEHDACKSRSSERDWRSQPRASKAGEAGMEEEVGYMMLWALAPRGAVQKQKGVRSKQAQSQEKNIPPF